MKFRIILYALVLTLMVLGTATAEAQDIHGTTPEERAESLTNWMKDYLNLEESQIEPVNKVNLKFTQQMSANWEANKRDMDALLKGGEEIDKVHTSDLAETLRPTQWTKYQRFKNNNRVPEKERYRMYRALGGGE